MGLKILDCRFENWDTVLKLSKSSITESTESATYQSGSMTVVNGEIVCGATDFAELWKFRQVFNRKSIPAGGRGKFSARFAIVLPSVKSIMRFGHLADRAKVKSLGAFATDFMISSRRIAENYSTPWAGYRLGWITFSRGFLHAFLAARLFVIRTAAAGRGIEVVLTVSKLITSSTDSSTHKMKYSLLQNFHLAGSAD